MSSRAGLGARIAGSAVAMAAAVGIAHGSHVPMPLATGTDATLRVAWSASPERIETCRDLTDAELEALPVHMRRRTSCEGTTARYRLEVRRDGQVISAAELRGGGMRGDRQLYVFRELMVPSGPSDIDVTLVRLDSSVSPASRASDEEARSDEARDRRVADMIPARLEFRGQIALAPREVVLVTYDRELRRLRMVRQRP